MAVEQVSAWIDMLLNDRRQRRR